MNTVLMAEQLNGEYRQVFERVDLYCTATGIATEVAEDKMMNLFDLFMTAQSNGKPVEKIIGKDVEKFCISYFEDYSLKERIKHIPDILYKFCWLVLIFSVIELFEQGIDKGLAEGILYRTDILPFVIGLAIGQLFFGAAGFIVSRLMFRFPKIAPMKFYISIIIMFVVAVSVVSFWGDDIELTVLIPIVLIIAVCAAYIAVYWGVRAYRRYCDHGSIFKEREKIRHEDSEGFILETGESLIKKFYRKNKRRKRRGKAEWTIWEYMEYLCRQDAKEVWKWHLMALFYVVVVAVPVIHTLLIEGMMDALILAGILVVIEIPIYFSCKKLSDFGVRCRKKLMQECQAHAMDLIEYVAYLREKTGGEERGEENEGYNS